MKVASIILCAGVGSRLKSGKSKILHELCGRPLGYWPIKKAMAVTDLKPIVVLSHQAQTVEAQLKRYFHDDIRFAYQKEPNGTGGAVLAGLEQLDPSAQSVLIVYGDTPLIYESSLKRLVTIQHNSHVPVALFTSFAKDPSGYGRIVRNHAQQITGIVEDHEATPLEREINEINPGGYVFDVEYLRENINKLSCENLKHEYYLTDLVHMYIRDNPQFGPVGSVEIGYEEMRGINDRRQLAYAQKVLNQRILEKWMLEGVTFIDPDNTYVEENVVLARDVVIYPGVHLRGTTHIGEGAVIENGAIIIDTVIENDAHILPYTWCNGAYVGARSQIGPFARLRPESKIECDATVGNFIEIKRSRIHSGAKAGHFAYLGDAEVGASANIGAGTVTCNYDGKNKHRTVIKAGAFIGSNSTLIAPLSVGNDAYIAGGSTISKEVGDDTLAIGRARQINKEPETKRKLLEVQSRVSK